MNKLIATLRTSSLVAFAAAACAASMATHAARFVVVNADAPLVGLNDTIAAAPVGGNSGVTLGQQRLIALNYIAGIWGRALNGTNATFEVLVAFVPRGCTATEGTLASAGPFTVFRDFDNAKFPGTWYPGALANKLAGIDLDVAAGESSPEIAVTPNINVGKADCIAGSGWYYGLDGKAPADGFDFVKTILHEFGHGVGFLSFVDETTGEYFDNYPSVWEHFLIDGKTNKRWVNMSNAERQASALNNQFLAWTGFKSYIGAQQTLATKSVLDLFVVDAQVGGFYAAGTFDFGPGDGQRSAAGLLGILDDTRAPGAACAPLTSAQVDAVKRRVAVIKRGGCAFTTKVFNAQVAGASAVIIDNNNPVFAGRPLAGTPDPALNITIPSAFISMQDGAKLRASTSRFMAVAFTENRRPAGTDLFRRPLMFAPTVALPGSSVSHWDIFASPNLLMEPFAVGDESITLKPPTDLTLPLMQDIGW